MTTAADISPATALAGAARGLLGRDVGVAALEIDGPLPPVHAEEAVAIANAVEKRRREFTAGRAAARDALAQVGVMPRAIPAGSDRAPRWPGGTTGSITHTGGIAMAAAARTTRVRSLGLDLEPAEPLDEALFDTVLTPLELREVAELPPDEQGARAKLIFSAKECAFKCQYPLSGAMLDFQDLLIRLDPAGGVFHAVPAQFDAGADSASWMCGRHAVVAGHVLTAMVLRR